MSFDNPYKGGLNCKYGVFNGAVRFDKCGGENEERKNRLLAAWQDNQAHPWKRPCDYKGPKHCICT